MRGVDTHGVRLFPPTSPISTADAAGLRADLSRLLGLVRGEPGIAGERVVTPGDIEAETAAGRRHHGIPLTEEEWSFCASPAADPAARTSSHRG